MLLIFWEELNWPLAALDDSSLGEPEDPLWALGQDGKPTKLKPKPWPQRHFLDACKLEVVAPTSAKKLDAAQAQLSKAMREKLACALASIVEAAGLAGDFRIFEHSRDWAPDPNLCQMRMSLTVSAAMCGCFMEGPASRESRDWPSPKRILSKIRDVELAARISREMAVQDVMSE